MIRTTAVPRSVRVGTAAASVVGIAVLAGCAASTTPATSETDPSASATSPSTTSPSSATTESGTDGTATTSAYTDGTYTAEGSYATPESVETISVTVTIADDVVTSVEVTGNPTKRESEEYQAKFIGGIKDEVVGKNIDEISVSRVAGSSLTSGGFNEAIDTIKAEAAA
ncbi:hypothetical protein [Microbacterium sp.]|uniref:FMN-binding protein n=1 Tax=Microbacterium sp. TaxID=51671 RepID=UPI0039E2E4BE